jgi:hypothetical protein
VTSAHWGGQYIVSEGFSKAGAASTGAASIVKSPM